MDKSQGKPRVKSMNCKAITTKTECDARELECVWNKSNKCQKKPTRTKTNKNTGKLSKRNSPIKIQNTELSISPSPSLSTPLLYQSPTLSLTSINDSNTEMRVPDVEIIETSPPKPASNSKTSSTLTIPKTNSCNEIKQLTDLMKDARKKYDERVRECEDELFGKFIETYFDTPDKLTHKGLLVGLQKYYQAEKKNDVNFVLSMHDFIQKFSQKTSVKGTNYKRQHIFEALCRLLLLLNYDNNEFGNDKVFYTSLEQAIEAIPKRLSANDIFDSKVNEGSKNGVVDIYFTHKRPAKTNDDSWACEKVYAPTDKITPNVESQPEHILIQNKYYDKEKSNISNYDVTKIFTLAKVQKEKRLDGQVRIVLMVNNEDSLSYNLTKAKQQYPTLVYKIYGVSTLNQWFQRLLYDLFTSNAISGSNSFFKSNSDVKPRLHLRFHQKYMVECSKRFIYSSEQHQTDPPRKSKFVWGAVPRSGKSYMIGGLISDRYAHGNRNNIVIILGALTETLGQFKKMFQGLADFNGYNIVDPNENASVDKSIPSIYLFSQEWLKDKVNITSNTDVSKSTFKHLEDKKNIKTKYPHLFENKHIDLYFDEIHKGGSTDISESIIHAFKNASIDIDIFVMVTATFAKPAKRYTNIQIGTGSQDIELIEWSYNDQQNMKQLTNETQKNMMIQTRKGVQQSVIGDIFYYYQEYYGASYLNALATEYQKHPELVLVTPQSINAQSNANVAVLSTEDIRNVFVENLKCDACRPNESDVFYKNPANIFKNQEPVNNLLNYISFYIYNYFKNALKYPIDNPHTELWFLPDKHLYSQHECNTVCEKQATDEGMDEAHSTLSGLPNIEPLSRGLSIKICQHGGFNRYNVLIVHNTKLTYLGKRIVNGKQIFGEFKNDNNQERIQMFSVGKGSASLSDQIKRFEIDSYKNQKSLIVLTGAKLRLGISLPCADIAFNFDDIKSIDNNYQTMFRVLTEREVPEMKRYGYYVDFNKDRSVQFIYEYNKIYGEAKKLGSKEAVESLQSLLFVFNYNGLNIVKGSTQNELELYQKLITDLELNEEGYSRFWSQRENIISLLKKTLATIKLTNVMTQLFRELKFEKSIANKKTGKVILKKGNPRMAMPTEYPSGEVSGEASNEETATENANIPPPDEDTTDDEDYGVLINSIAEQLPTIIVLLAMFSSNKDRECSDIEECLRHSLIDIQSMSTDTVQCNCTNLDNANILDCFLNSPGLINGHYNYDRVKLVKIIELLIRLIYSDAENDILRINLNFIFDNIKKVMTKSDGIIQDMTDKDIEDKIEQYLTVKEDEKNKFGEVFTPPALIGEMMDELPKSVWSNPELKLLDPANGVGNFPMVAYRRLMEGLAKWEPNEKKRSKHIIEKMLYMIEINPKNVKISKKIFGSKANICCADFLDETQRNKCFEKWGVNAFDIIIGNPPFQKEQEGKREGGYGGRTLWDKFIIEIIKPNPTFKPTTILKDNGYLCFITPPPWRKPEHELFDLMTKQNQLVYLHIFGERQGQQLFDVSQRVDLYIIQNKPKYKNTEIVDELGTKLNLDLSKWCFLPNYDYENIKKIMTTVENGIPVIYSSSIYETRKPYVKENQSDKYKYPVVHSINQDGLVFWYTDDTTKGHFDVPKVLLNFNRHQYPVNDFNGKYGMSQITFGIPITSKKQGDDIVKAINTDEFKEIIKATKWGAFQTDWRMFKYFKPDFYKYFLKENNATKIQALVRGHQQRAKTEKLKNTVTKVHSKTRGGRKQRKKLNATKTAPKGGNRTTRKNKRSFFSLW
jgi:hypothetical protein